MKRCRQGTLSSYPTCVAKPLPASVCSVAVALLLPTFVFAQLSPLPSVAFKLGDDVPTVKAALHTTVEPEAIARNPALPATFPDMNKGKSVLHLRTKDIWAFFNPTGTVETIRLDAPFKGDILGVKLGDGAGKITSTLGNPLTKPSTAFVSMRA
jgi:hypothetical protein